MIALIGYYWYGLLLALFAGLATARWTWGYRPAGALTDFDPDAESIAWSSFTPPMPGADMAEAEAALAHPDDDESVPETTADAEEAPAVAVPDIAAAGPEAEEVTGEDDAHRSPAELVPEEPLVDATPALAEPEHAPDDLLTIKGIGPELDALLRGLGVTRFEQIASWMPEDIERIDGQLGAFKGRILRDEWIGQARLLARGDMATFEQRYGHL